MLELLLLRHAKAAREPGLADHARPLTERGRRNAEGMGAWLASENRVPEVALVSDAKRTRQTFKSAHSGFGGRPRVVFDPAIYDGTEDTLLSVLHAVPDSPTPVLMCGHNPSLHDLATALVGGGDAGALKLFRQGFPTACLAVVTFDVPRWSDARSGTGTLVRFVTPATVAGDAGDDD